MIVRSNIITRQQVIDAVCEARVAGHDVITIESVREFKPRAFQRGYEVFLGAFDGNHASAHDPSWKAATWDAWGVVIDALYRVDADAQIAWYSSRSDFLAKTRAEHERIAQWHKPESYQARTHRAPWLEREEAAA